MLGLLLDDPETLTDPVIDPLLLEEPLIVAELETDTLPDGLDETV
jgi:hypothetical protein